MKNWASERFSTLDFLKTITKNYMMLIKKFLNPRTLGENTTKLDMSMNKEI